MDKTDYRKYGEYPRWIDLDKIIKYVINIKKQYTTWTLLSLSRGGQLDMLPPDTFYRYVFKDDRDNYFTIGCIVVLTS